MVEQKIEIPFIGGKIEIVPPGTYTDPKTGESKKSYAKVKMGSMVDSWGNISPGVFLEMILAVTKNNEALKLLERIK